MRELTTAPGADYVAISLSLQAERGNLKVRINFPEDCFAAPLVAQTLAQSLIKPSNSPAAQAIALSIDSPPWAQFLSSRQIGPLIGSNSRPAGSAQPATATRPLRGLVTT
jgi:hypothetical protein